MWPIRSARRKKEACASLFVAGSFLGARRERQRKERTANLSDSVAGYWWPAIFSFSREKGTKSQYRTGHNRQKGRVHLATERTFGKPHFPRSSHNAHHTDAYAASTAHIKNSQGRF